VLLSVCNGYNKLQVGCVSILDDCFIFSYEGNQGIVMPLDFILSILDDCFIFSSEGNQGIVMPLDFILIIIRSLDYLPFVTSF